MGQFSLRRLTQSILSSCWRVAGTTVACKSTEPSWSFHHASPSFLLASRSPNHKAAINHQYPVFPSPRSYFRVTMPSSKWRLPGLEASWAFSSVLHCDSSTWGRIRNRFPTNICGVSETLSKPVQETTPGNWKWHRGSGSVQSALQDTWTMTSCLQFWILPSVRKLENRFSKIAMWVTGAGDETGSHSQCLHLGNETTSPDSLHLTCSKAMVCDVGALPSELVACSAVLSIWGCSAVRHRCWFETGRVLVTTFRFVWPESGFLKSMKWYFFVLLWTLRIRSTSLWGHSLGFCPIHFSQLHDIVQPAQPISASGPSVKFRRYQTCLPEWLWQCNELTVPNTESRVWQKEVTFCKHEPLITAL